MLAYVRDIAEKLAPNRRFWSQAIYRCHWNLFQTVPCCHGNQKLGIL